MYVEACVLFEIEAEDNHLCVCLAHGFGEAEHISVAKLVWVIGVEAVAKTINELQFGTELEERQVEVAAETYLRADVVAFQLYVIGALAAEVYHRVETCHEVRTMVVEPWRGENEVER